MYYNGNNKYRVSTFMKEVHNLINLKYGQVRQRDIQEANKLQKFFRDIKIAAQNDNGIIENEAIRMIIESLKLPNGEKLKNLFKGTGSKGGFRFERELTAIIEAVFSNLTEDEIDIGKINVGGQTANIDLKDYNDKMTQKILKEVGTQTQKKVENEDKKGKKQYYLSDVDGKIDVKGYHINIKVNPNNELLEIYEILKDATFTAKNYNSMTWDEKAKQYVEMKGHKTLTLGKTNLYRSIVGTLSSLGFEGRTAESALWAGLNKIKDGDNDVANHFYHLRYIYELTGAGLSYNGESFGEARFLIYNDPSGELYVKASSEILIDIFENHIDSNKVLSTITIPKSKFLN